MFTTHIDLGQIILSSMIGIVGWFIKRELSSINGRLDNHDSKFYELVGQVNMLLGAFNARQQGR